MEFPPLVEQMRLRDHAEFHKGSDLSFNDAPGSRGSSTFHFVLPSSPVAFTLNIRVDDLEWILLY